MVAFAFSFGQVWSALGLPLRAIRGSRLVKAGSFVSLVIDGPVVELAEPAPFWRRRTSRTLSLMAVRRLVSLIAKDPKVKGLVVEIRSLRTGAAVATSLREALFALRASGKALAVHLPMGAGSREMLVASAADRIFMGPQSTILPLGVAVETRYLRRALDKIGVLPEIFARGEFKTAGESLARDAMSNEQHEQLGALLDVLGDELEGALSSSRGIERDRVRQLVDSGPFRAAEAVENGLVDHTAYDDELPKLLSPSAEVPRCFVPAAAYLAVRRAPPLPKRVGVVHVKGPIVSRAPMAFGRVAVDERVMAALAKARESRRIAGVVVVIDSPGGSVLASDRIYHEVLRLAEKKPVVAYFGNVAASGGYYVASAAHAIVAQPTTVTGSIGVVAAHLVLAPLLAKVGVVTEIVKRGARADMLSSSRTLDEGERAAMTREIEGFYLDFVGVVARGRHRAPEEIDKLARGRVYSGREAAANGLVDQLGNFETAIDLVRERLGEPRELGPAVMKLPTMAPRPPEVPGPFVDVMDSLGGRALGDLVALALSIGPTERVLAFEPMLVS
ncbi:MAG TPA: signal peptide peptidase SppA [Polyangiaceae bacterium]|nr:signal peptide peptidase SppA [Polyangiaceae bacterium]